jgi:hypothetical protein
MGMAFPIGFADGLGPETEVDATGDTVEVHAASARMAAAVKRYFILLY